MKPDKKQTYFMIGVVLLVVAGILIYASLSQPRVYVVDETQAPPTTQSVSTTIDVNINVSVSFPIDLNDATVDDLMAVDGIGEKRAIAIIEYRTTLGGYSSVEQIKQISGIGDDVYNDISQYLTV